MSWNDHPQLPASLCFVANDRPPFDDDAVRTEIGQAFAQSRAFPFYPDAGVVESLRSGTSRAALQPRFDAIRERIIEGIADVDRTVRRRFLNSLRLPNRIAEAVARIHMLLAWIEKDSLLGRRFVLIRERPASPTIYHVDSQATVIARVGQGRITTEIPTIYLGLSLFDLLLLEERRGESVLQSAMEQVLLIEERAIETGYAHTEPIAAEQARALDGLLERLIRLAGIAEEVVHPVPIPRGRPFTERNRAYLLGQLNARQPDEELRFDHAEAVRAMDTLERMARRFKTRNDRASLREVTALLVAASGHDVHEVRHRANILLERIFAPKEMDAPIATVFRTVSLGRKRTQGYKGYIERESFQIYFEAVQQVPGKVIFKNMEITGSV